MQNTRLNTLFDRTSESFSSWVRNPWRRFSLVIISLLLGNFLGTTVSTVAGQKAELDVVAAAVLVVITEFMSRVAYRSPPEKARSLLIEVPNALKIGFVYSLFVEAFKLGS